MNKLEKKKFELHKTRARIQELKGLIKVCEEKILMEEIEEKSLQKEMKHEGRRP